MSQSDLALSVRGLSKSYTIKHNATKHTTMGEALAHLFKPAPAVPGRRRGKRVRQSVGEETFWALKNVDFDIYKGDVVGVIGRNGAGKSTLLKILSRVTEPTTGEIDVYGKIGSLLEVGTGFHPELTGRENIFLNGSILGMNRREVQTHFDDIVAFAEVEQFLDTPVKRYSSGMYVRLAFAVAAHLSTDTLIVDEVLAVGDAEFQKKCLGKMGDVAKTGRTVLFVSHNIGTINTLTKKCIYLKKGQVGHYADTKEVVSAYLMESVQQRTSTENNLDFYRRNTVPDTPIKINKIWVNEEDGADDLPTVFMGQPFSICVEVEVNKPVHGANMNIILKTFEGSIALHLFSWDNEFSVTLPSGRHVLSSCVKNIALAPNDYAVEIGINQSTQTIAYDVIRDYPLMHVTSGDTVTQWLERPWGAVHADSVSWQLVK